MSAADWKRSLTSWSCGRAEEAAQHLADIGIGSDAAAAAAAAQAAATARASELTDKEKATRKYIRLLAEQSTKAYGALWSALPEELRAQARQSVPENFAYGLAHWLETKLQSTEQDNVGELLAQWVALRQEEDESFDAYRARVNHVLALLEHAKEKPSARQHAFMLLDRLQPRYKPAVLALKLGDLLKKRGRASSGTRWRRSSTSTSATSSALEPTAAAWEAPRRLSWRRLRVGARNPMGRRSKHLRVLGPRREDPVAG